MKKTYFFLAGCLIGSSIAASAKSPGDELRCYWFDAPNFPQEARLMRRAERERWCYLDLEAGAERRKVLVFNGDTLLPRPELAALVESDRQGRILAISHSSRFQGELTTVRVTTPRVNPLGVPLLEPQAGSRAHEAAEERVAASLGAFARPAAHLGRKANALARARALLSRLQMARNLPPATRIEPGTSESFLEDSQLPFRGHWWPMHGAPLGWGSASPLAKYDRLAEIFNGFNPRSAEWEVANHADGTTYWGGHCNGWAASAILYKEPRRALRDPLTGITLSVADQKGLLTEASSCVNHAFYGKRYMDEADDLKDIAPHEFHNVILYYLGQLRKPVVLDHRPGREVDNHVATGYWTQIAALPAPGRYAVTTTLRMHGYDFARNDAIGPAPSYQRAYRYELVADADGNAVAGEWKSENPDFAWVPLSQKKCHGENPRLDAELAETFLKTLGGP